jgi:hypothetical protein
MPDSVKSTDIMDDTSATESDIDASSVESNLHCGNSEDDYIINIDDTKIMNRRTGMGRSSSNSSLMSGAASVESSLGSDLLLDEDLEDDSDEGSEHDYTVEVNMSPVKRKKNRSGSLNGSCHSIKDLLIIDAITEEKELTCSSDEESSESSSGDEFFFSDDEDDEDGEDGEDELYEDTVMPLKVGSSHDRKPRAKNLPKKLDISSLDNVKITGMRLDSMLDKPVEDPLMAKFLNRRRGITPDTDGGTISSILNSTDSLDQVFGKGQRAVKTRSQPNCKSKTTPGGVHDDPLMKRFLNKNKNSTRGSRDTILNSIVGSSDSLQHVVGKGKRVVRSLPKGTLTPVAFSSA